MLLVAPADGFAHKLNGVLQMELLFNAGAKSLDSS